MHNLQPSAARWAAAGLLAVVMLSVFGCSTRRTYPVHGKVVFPDGKPLQGGSVAFEAVAPEANKVNARGAIKPDGTFSLGTYSENDGALLGEHRAYVMPPILTDADLAKGIKHWIDPMYRHYDTSGLKFTVEPRDNEFNITVKKSP